MSSLREAAIRAYTPYEDRAARALRRALEDTPAYAAWRELDPGPGADLGERYAALPWLTKTMLREGGVEAFIPRGRALPAGLESGEIELVETSGTTGDRVTNIWCQPWWDGSERASWKLNSATEASALGDHREAILTSPHCAGVPCEDGYLDMERRRLGRFLYLNERSDPCTWTRAHQDRMIDELERFAPVTLEANPSFLARLCRHLVSRGTRSPSVRHIFCTYEAPQIRHRRLALETFGLPLVSSYGTTEAGTVYLECESGRLHQNTQSCAVDFLPLAPVHGGPALGRLLVTTFENPWRSLLRFDVGDIARLATEPCPCGRREGLTLEGIEGRVTNLTWTGRGHAVTPAAVDRALAPIPGLEEYRVVQTAPAVYEAGFTTQGRRGLARRVGREVRDALVQLYGEGARVLAMESLQIHPDPPGKYRTTRCEVPMDLTTLVAAHG